MFYVMRTYSGVTAQKTLTKVLSRPIEDIRTAEAELRFHQSMEPKHKCFIVKMISDEDLIL